MYFCTDTGNIYIDYKDGSTVLRKLINKDSLDKKLNLTGGTISGKLTFSGTSADTANLAFSREGYNYITFPTGGNLALATSASGDGIVVGISSAGMYPYSNNTKTLGTSDKKWSNVYATNFTGSGASLTSLNASNISSGTLSSDRLPTIPIAKGGTGATTAAGALTNLGITATAAELNKLDGVTATTTELNYVDGVTSNIQDQLDSKLSKTTAAGSSLGLVKSGGDVTISDGVITVKDDSHNHIIANVDGLQDALDNKADITKWSCSTTVGKYSRLCEIVNHGSSLLTVQLSQSSQSSIHTFMINTGWNAAKICQIGSNGFTVNYDQTVRVVQGSDSNHYYIEILNNYGYNGATTTTIICRFLSITGTTCNPFTEYTATSDNVTVKDSVETHHDGITSSKFYGDLEGNAATATALTSKSIGSTTQPVYFDANGKPVATTYTLSASVPSDAKFTDTNTKVTQSRSTTVNYRSLLMHNGAGSYGTNPGEVTNTTYYNETIAACPSTGDVRATTFTGALKGNADTATKATQDGSGNTITSTYATKTELNTLDTAYDAHKHTVYHMPAGTVSKPTFTGSAVDSGTPSGTTSVYSITSVGSAPSLTATVSNKCLTLSWSAGSVPARSSVTVASSEHKHSVTAAGTVSQPTFTGTAATLTSSTPA